MTGLATCGCAMFPESPCSLPATQEDLLCDDCRDVRRLRYYFHISGAVDRGPQPHQILASYGDVRFNVEQAQAARLRNPNDAPSMRFKAPREPADDL